MRNAVVYGWTALALAALLAACADASMPVEVGAHPDGWARADQHGRVVLEGAGKSANCASCHGADYRGGTSGVSCSSGGCHAGYPHPVGFAAAEGPSAHPTILAERLGYDVTRCRSCHGADYAGGGFAEKSCRTCHTQPAGPEACNTCHGDAHSAAPPADLAGRTETTFASVGAHRAHLGPEATGANASCQACHAGVTTFTSEGHLDTGIRDAAEVRFGAVATGDGRLAPAYDAATGSCSDVYCHGNFRFEQAGSKFPWAYAGPAITGTPTVVRWTDVGSGQAACGSCHALPPAGHRQSDARVPIMEECSRCHPSVLDDATRTLDGALHANGRVDIVLDEALGKLMQSP